MTTEIYITAMNSHTHADREREGSRERKITRTE